MKKATIIIAAFGLITLSGCQSGRNRQAQKFSQMARSINQSCPQRMSETIRLDSTNYDEKNNVMSYFYSVSGELDDAAYMSARYDTFKQALQKAIDNSMEMEEYRNYGTSIRYVYFSGSNQKQLAEFSFNSPK